MECKKSFEREQDYERKGMRLAAYRQKQKELAARIEQEDEEEVRRKFEKMITAANKGGFWRERRRQYRDEAATWMVTKDEEGKRIFDKEKKENIASYCKNL